MIWADDATHAKVAKLLEELKTAVAMPQQMIKVHRFEPEELDVTTVYNALSPDDMKDLSIQVNSATNSLIVRGPANRQVELSETLANLVDELPQAEKPTAKVYRLDRADPYAASLMIRSLLPGVPVAVDAANRTLAVTAVERDHAKIQKVLDELDNKDGGDLIVETYIMKRANPSAVMAAIQPVVPQAKISADIYNKMLIVTATAEQQKQIKAIIEQADGRGEGEQLTKAYSLKYANPYTISQALRTVVPEATVGADAVNKMLIVTASAKDHERIQSVLDQADKQGGGDLETKAYVLQLANPATIAAALASVVPNAKTSADVTNSMLIVTATPEDQKRVQSVVDEADRKSEGDVITKVYALTFANPLALSYSIKPIAPNAKTSPDPTNKTLIVTATAKDHERIKTVIDQADKRGGGDLITTAYSLKWANPAILATALAAVVPNATISNDVYNKMLIVTANKEDHEKIKAVIDKADERGGGDLITRTYTLQTANPSTIMIALRPIVPDATISSDVTNRMLIVTASEEDHKTIATIVDDADQRSDGELTTEVYALKWANPTALKYSLAPIAPNATISPDVYNKTLIVTANAKDHARIKAVVDQADQRGGGDLTTKAYPVKWAYPATIAAALTTVVPDAKVTSDVTNKMLIVTANEEDHKRIQEVLEQADQRGGGELTTKAYTLKWANPAIIASSLATVVPDAKISSDVYNKMLLVTANAEDHKKIQAVLDEADKLGGGERITKAYPLKWAYAPTVATALSSVVPDAKISPDATNKMLLVTADEADHKRIQEVIDQADKRGGGDLVTKTYPLRRANPATIMQALRPIVPDATISADMANRVLIATASEEDHSRIKNVVDDTDGRGEGDLVTEAYSLKWANPSTLVAALMPVVPNAIVSPDPTNKTLVVTASSADQALVKKVVEQADRRGNGEMTTEVYLLTRANPLSVQRALTPLMPDATIGSDATSKTLIVSAPADDQEKIKKIVERADRRGEGELLTKVYPFKVASPTTAATALETLIPNALMSPDTATNTLIVTATAEDHKQVEPLVKELDVPSPTTRVLKPYSVQNADPEQVYQSLSQLFRTNRDVSVGFQEDTGMILVFASAADQDEVSRAIEDIDKITAGRPKATLEVYSLEGLDGDAAITGLKALLADQTPKVELQVDDNNNQVLAIGEPQQQEMIRKALSQLAPQDRDVEVFTLQQIDPYSAESAISTMFEDLPFAAMPSVEADPDTQQLIVRATTKQMGRIKELLEKMGESAVQKTTKQSTSMLRVIPLSGNVDATLRDLQRIWPQVRGNDIQIVTPPRRRFLPSEPTVPAPQTPSAPQNKPESAGQKPNGEPPAANEQGPPDHRPASSPENPKKAGSQGVSSPDEPKTEDGTAGKKTAQFITRPVMFVSAKPTGC